MIVTKYSTAKYLAHAHALSRALDDSWADYDLISGGARLVYFVDSNVALWYGSPQRAMASSFLALPDLDEESAERGAEDGLAALIAVDNIFSATLPGATFPFCCLTPAHSEELENRLVAISSAARTSGANDPSPEDRSKGVFDDFFGNLKSFEVNSSSDALASLYRAFVSLVKPPGRDAGFSLTRMGRLIRRGGLQRADTLFGIDVDFDPGLEDGTHEWKRRLEGHRIPQEGENTVNIESDARSLAFIEGLNQKAANEKQATHYVLISLDRSIHFAISSWIKENRKRGLETRSFARHPRQYAPMLLSPPEDERPTHETAKFWDLRNALGDVVASFSGLPEIDSDAAVRHFSQDLAPLIEQRLKDSDVLVVSGAAGALQESWQSAVRSTTLCSAPTLLADAREQLQKAIELMEQPAIGGGLDARLVVELESIRRSHVLLAIKGRLIATVARAKSRQRKFPTPIPSRGPLLFDFPLPPTIVNNKLGAPVASFDINSFLDWVFSRAFNEAQVSELERVITTIGQPNAAYTIAAAVCYRAGAWRSARHFAKRGLDLSKEADDAKVVQELKYCIWVSTRFIALDFREFQDVRSDIFRSLQTYRQHRDMFRFARACSEAAAVIIYFVIQRITSPQLDTGPTRAYFADLLRDALRNISVADGLVRRQRSAGARGKLWARLKLQIKNNECVIVLLRALVFTEDMTPVFLGRAVKAYQELARLTAEKEQWHVGLGGVHVAVLRWLLHSNTQAKGKYLESALTVISRAPAELGALTELDLRYLEWLAKALLAREKSDVIARSAT